MENKRASVDLKKIAIPIANNPLLIYKGCLIILYKPLVVNFILFFKAGDTPICLCANIFIRKLIPKIIIPAVKATDVGIAIFEPSVKGKTITGTIKVKKAKILVRDFGILFSTLANASLRLSTTIVVI